MQKVTKYKDQLSGIITEVEENTEKYTPQVRALLRALVAARRVCEKIEADNAILSKQGREYFEATLPIEKKPIKIEGLKPKTDNIKKPR